MEQRPGLARGHERARPHCAWPDVRELWRSGPTGPAYNRCWRHRQRLASTGKTWGLHFNSIRSKREDRGESETGVPIQIGRTWNSELRQSERQERALNVLPSKDDWLIARDNQLVYRNYSHRGSSTSMKARKASTVERRSSASTHSLSLEYLIDQE